MSVTQYIVIYNLFAKCRIKTSYHLTFYICFQHSDKHNSFIRMKYFLFYQHLNEILIGQTFNDKCHDSTKHDMLLHLDLILQIKLFQVTELTKV